MKRLLTLLLIVTSLVYGEAQEFKSAVGGRLGFPFGITYKTFINETDAIDVSAGFSGLHVGTSLALLVQYQRHQEVDLDIAELEGIQVFYGAGVSGQAWRSNFWNESGLYFGGHATGGLSYTFEDFPLNLSFEINPGLFLGLSDRFNRGIFISYYTGLSGRYILAR